MATDLMVGLVNRPGSLQRASEALGGAGVNIEGACALHDLQQLRHGRQEPRGLFRQPDPGLRGLPLGAGIHPLSVGSDPRRRPQPEIVALRGRSAARSRSASPPGTATRDQRPCVVLLHNVTLSAVLM